MSSENKEYCMSLRKRGNKNVESETLTVTKTTIVM